MSITLGRKSAEIEKVFSSVPGAIVYKSLKVDIEASETPKETIVNLHVTIQCNYVPWWRRIFEDSKRLFSRSNS